MSLDPALHERLVFEWTRGVWIGAVKRAFGPVAELVAGSDGVLVDNHPPHSLLVLWKPAKVNEPPFLRRLPWMVSIHAALDTDEALAELFGQLPDDKARLFIARHDIDWALMAEIVMLSETGLAPYHYRELERFVQEEREHTLAAISAGYTRDEGGFRQFVKTVRDELSLPPA